MAGGSTTAPELVERLAKGKPVPALTLLGSETYLRDMCRRLLVETFTEEASRDWAVSRFSAEDDEPGDVIGQAQMLPMLAARQVVFWRDVEALERLGDDSRDAIVKRLNEYLDNPAPFTILVLEAERLDQRTKLFKALSDKTLLVSCELGEEGRVPIASTIAQDMAGELKLELPKDAALLLAESTNADLARMHTELEKLAVYAGDRKKLTREDVEALVVSESKHTVWQLAEMMANGDQARAMSFLHGLLRDGEQPVAIVGVLAWMCRKLLETQELGRGADVWKVQRLGMRRETAEMAIRAAPRIPRVQLIEGLKTLADADSRLKGGAADKDALMDFLVAGLTKRAVEVRG